MPKALIPLSGSSCGSGSSAAQTRLTSYFLAATIFQMQVTLDLPPNLARRLEAKQDRLTEIIERGLRDHAETGSAHWLEIIRFLASGPKPQDIIAFRPSKAHVARSRELLAKNRERNLTPEEQAEIDEIEHINHLMILLKIEARKSSDEGNE
jgi:hypothetical protein